MTTTLPLSMKKFFWDIDADALDPLEKAPYVINRLLDKGDLEAAKWVLTTYSKEVIIDTFKTRRDFSPWNGTFWAHYLEISPKEVACLQPSYQSERKMLWPH